MRHILTLLFSFFYFAIVAQEKKLEHLLGKKFVPAKIENATGKKTSCSFLLNIDSIKAIVLDNNGNKIDEFAVNCRYANEKYLGSFINDDNIYLYMDNGDDPGIRVWVFNSNNHTMKDNVIRVKRKRDKMLSRISIEKRFFYLTINKSSADFVIYDFKDEMSYDSIHYTADAVTEKKIRKDLIWFAPEYDVQNASVPGEPGVEIAASQNKFYFRNDTLFLLSNKTRSVTTVFELDLINKKITSRDIQHNHDEENSVDNSFLLNDRLYYVSATSKRIFVQVADFYSGKILKEFSAKEDEEISFKNSAITNDGTFGERELNKTRQLVRKMVYGNALIAASPDVTGKLVRLSIGSFKKFTTTSPGLFPGSAGFVTGSWNRVARIKMLFDPQTNEHVPGELAPTINDKTEEYSKQKQIKIPFGVEDLFVCNETYFYCYYDEKLKTYNVVKF